MLYALLSLVFLGVTAGAVYVYVSGYAAFRNLYPWILLFEGLFIVLVGAVGHSASKEAKDEMRPDEKYIHALSGAWYRFVERTELEYDWLFIVVGATLFGIAFYLLWLWSV